jgi:hypothetical protein
MDLSTLTRETEPEKVFHSHRYDESFDANITESINEICTCKCYLSAGWGCARSEKCTCRHSSNLNGYEDQTPHGSSGNRAFTLRDEVTKEKVSDGRNYRKNKHQWQTELRLIDAIVLSRHVTGHRITEGSTN